VDHAVALAEQAAPEHADPRLAARDRAIVELLYGSGLRLGELTGLDLRPGRDGGGWVDAADATAHVLGKGSKRRSVPVGRAGARRPGGLAGLPRRHRRAGRGGAVRQAARAAPHPSQLRVRLRRLAQAAGLPTDVHPHMLRHSFAVAPAAVQRRPARRAGAAGPRQHRHHAGLHAAGLPAPGQGLRRGPPARAAALNRPRRAAALTIAA
jgi:site-specific recombinase XerC